MQSAMSMLNFISIAQARISQKKKNNPGKYKKGIEEIISQRGESVIDQRDIPLRSDPKLASGAMAPLFIVAGKLNRFS